MLVLTLGHGTHAFTLDREQGSFVLTKRDMRVPEETKEFAINMSNQRHWEEPMQAYVRDLLAGREGPRGKDRSEEHTSELQSLLRHSYAVFCFKKTNKASRKQKH